MDSDKFGHGRGPKLCWGYSAHTESEQERFVSLEKGKNPRGSTIRNNLLPLFQTFSK